MQRFLSSSEFSIGKRDCVIRREQVNEGKFFTSCHDAISRASWEGGETLGGYCFIASLEKLSCTRLPSGWKLQNNLYGWQKIAANVSKYVNHVDGRQPENNKKHHV